MFAPADVTDNATNQEPQFSNDGEVDPLGVESSQASNQTEAGPSNSMSSQSNDDIEAGPANPIIPENFQLNDQAEAGLPLPTRSQSNNQTKSSPTIADISPLPKSSQIKRFTNPKKGKFGMLNASPDIAQLKAVVSEKKAASLRKCARQAKKKIVLAVSSDEEELVASDDEDPSSIYCMEPWNHSRTKEWWLQCQLCRQWCHAERIGLPKTSKKVICDVCK